MVDGAIEAVQASVEEAFVRRWGDMGAAWGINRTMAEIQGLLYITGASLNTDQIMARLTISRGNANMSLRALVDWGVVRKIHLPGDRRDYYRSLDDVWEIFRRVAQQRKRKEIEPILDTLRECRSRLDSDRQHAPLSVETEQLRERLERMLNFLTLMEDLAHRFIKSDRGLAQLVELLGRPK